MEGNLKRNDKQQLEDWIGTGPKEFTLLYSARSNGCSNIAFHQRCDHQGPTVTVLYNQEGTVYGGYAGVSWTSPMYGIHVNSASEFLFRLKYNGTSKATHFPIKNNTMSGIFVSSGYGPTFGEGPDLATFNGTINNVCGFYALNVCMNFGHSYDTKGLTQYEFNNGNMYVQELEVYKVTSKQLLTRDREPWRKEDDLNEEVLYSLKEEIQSFKPTEYVDVTDVRLVLIGPVGAGKSSFFNSVDSVFTGHITQKACSGSAEQSVSTKYIPYRVKSNDCTPKFRVCDTPGLEETNGLDDLEFNYMLEGNMPDYYELNPNSRLKPATLGFKATPTFNDQVHCVIFVLDATTLDALSTKYLEKIKQFKQSLYKKAIEIPHMVLLTKVDKLCRDVEQDVTNIYKSVVVEEHVKKAAYLLGIPQLHIHPVKNYVTEVKCDVNVGIVVLRAIRHALNYANSFLQAVADRKSDDNMGAQLSRLNIKNDLSCPN